jgi:hypothetical protein
VTRTGAALAAALCIAGCGSDGGRNAAQQPTLPRQLGVALADRSDAVAHALDAGDECRALELAQQLQRQTIEAINDGRVPGGFQEPLQDRVNDLAARIRCGPPPVEQDNKENGNRGHGKGKKKGHEGND